MKTLESQIGGDNEESIKTHNGSFFRNFYIDYYREERTLNLTVVSMGTILHRIVLSISAFLELKKCRNWRALNTASYFLHRFIFYFRNIHSS